MTKNNPHRKTCVLAMSGGVDSSVAAHLLLNEGYNVIGITMKIWNFEDFPPKDSGCCSLEAIYNAREVSATLGIPHYTIDFTEKFNNTVISNFLNEYLDGRTPNPCVLCNKAIKWGSLLDKAEELGADYIATGHYAKINFNSDSNRYYVSVSEDKNKDQSYALWQLSQKELSRTIFPVGFYKKNKIREIASVLNLKTADTEESQEICFVPNNNYRELLHTRKPELVNQSNEGRIIYKNEVIGKHKGYTNYTIGQRRGLNISLGNPVYVSYIDSNTNTIYVDDEDGLLHTSFTARNINLMLYEKLTSHFTATVKIRYKDKGSEAELIRINDEEIRVNFIKPVRAITPGQSAVFYNREDIIGGGIIDRIIT